MAKQAINSETLAQARQMEEEAELTDVARHYEGLYRQSPSDRRIISRLLVVLRRMKAYKKEMQVINSVIRNYKEGLVAKQKAWTKAHRHIARTSLSLARSLQLIDTKGIPVSQDRFILSLLKRRAVVEQRLTKGKNKLS
ncbi:hypothetical protein QTN47_20000 [Danxiaibacter flavus]|uniref:Uncharacterized protein n=1 Tax=Danxiaibacter flavus TaxID=3049108 RepID=A0ABV3ZJU4_9BACT|nr:hypothetical protein QNM32_20010 [Chitinophagaceae bacterium DXS]